MKKRILFGLIAAMMAVSVAACGNKGTTENDKKDDAVTVEISSATDALNKVFETYAEDEKFMMMGGDMNKGVMGEAASFDMADVAAVEATLHISEAMIGKLDDAASGVHAMNANTFTGVAFDLKDGEDPAAFASELKDSVLATQWMCGFPEKLVIYTINDEYVVYVVGAADLIENFTSKVSTVYGDAAVKAADQVVE